MYVSVHILIYDSWLGKNSITCTQIYIYSHSQDVKEMREVSWDITTKPTMKESYVLIHQWLLWISYGKNSPTNFYCFLDTYLLVYINYWNDAHASSKQTNKQTNKQASKQASKQPVKQVSMQAQVCRIYLLTVKVTSLRYVNTCIDDTSCPDTLHLTCVLTSLSCVTETG